MIISKAYKVLAQFSPWIEISLRKIYWKNISKTSKYRPRQKENKGTSEEIIFNNIIENLKQRGIKKGNIIIVHSSYDLLMNSGLTPIEINAQLIDLVGNEGTVVMPAIRKYKEDGGLEEYLLNNFDEVITTYNVKRSRIISGILPFMLMRRKDSAVSRFPLNSIVAVGAHAKSMINSNLEGDQPSPHGPNSSWKFCVDNNAIVIGLGVEFPKYLTIMHVNEDCDSNWPIKDWYRKRKFEIIDGDFQTYKEVLERKPIWGSFFYAENKFRRDLIKNGILKIENIEGLDISIVESNLLIKFLQNHHRRGYPYYISRHNLKKYTQQ